MLMDRVDPSRSLSALVDQTRQIKKRAYPRMRSAYPIDEERVNRRKK